MNEVPCCGSCLRRSNCMYWEEARNAYNKARLLNSDNIMIVVLCKHSKISKEMMDSVEEVMRSKAGSGILRLSEDHIISDV